MNELNGKIRTATVLAFLVLMFASSIQIANAVDVHYKFDRPYYHPSETGILTLTFMPVAEDVVVTNVDLEVSGVALFHLIPSSQHPLVGLSSTGTTTVELPFTIPMNITPGEYDWTLRIEFRSGTPLSYNGRMTIKALGEEQPPPMWPWMSVVLVALALILLFTGKKHGKLTKRNGALMAILAPVIFILSGLFLANTIIYPAESLPYQIGDALCFVAAPILLVSGIVVYATARRVEKRTRRTATPQPPRASREAPTRACPRCGRDLSQLPADIKNCPYCGKAV